MRGNFTPLPTPTPPSSNSETAKAVNLAFCSIQHYFIRDIGAKFGIHNSPQSPDIGQNSDEGISDFQISGQSLIKENCYNSRTSDGIDMKFGPVTKLDKGNKKKRQKKFDSDVMLANYDVIVIFLIYGQFGAISKPDSGRTFFKTYIFINSNLLSNKI